MYDMEGLNKPETRNPKPSRTDMFAHAFRIPHSAFRNWQIPQSAFRIPHLEVPEYG
jgi:hypothetical protein